MGRQNRHLHGDCKQKNIISACRENACLLVSVFRGKKPDGLQETGKKSVASTKTAIFLFLMPGKCLVY
jgi:hypothetical protein